MSAFDEYAIDATPSNAVALAIEDHMQGGLVHWAFVDSLRIAEQRANAYPKLVEALKNAPQTSSANDLLRELGEL